MMKVLTTTFVFPNKLEPQLGIFVKQRMSSVAKLCKLKIIAPIPWYKFLKPDFKVSSLELQGGIEIYHPKFFYIPRFLKSLDGFFFFLSLISRARKLQKNFDFDLIDAHFAYPDGLGAVLLGKFFKKPVIVTLRGTIERLRLHPIIRRQIKWTLKNANHIIAVSDSLKRRAIELGISSNKITVIRNGIDKNKFYLIERDKARKKLALPLNKRILLSVGGLVERKGFHHIIDVLPAIIERDSNILYIIVGGPSVEGNIYPLIKQKIKDLKLEAYVKIVGPKPHNELIYWYNAADLFCLFSSKEGCPNVIIESLACGTPVISSEAGGAPELITNSKLGFIVSNKEQLSKILHIALNKSWNREHIAQYGQKYTWDNVAIDVLNIFKKVLTAIPHKDCDSIKILC